MFPRQYLCCATRELEDDYEEKQLNPVRSNTHRDLPYPENESGSESNIPEVTEMKLRVAALEAIVDEILEDAEEHADEKVDPTIPPQEEAIQKAEEVAETAIELRLVPSSFRTNLKKLLARRMRIPNRRIRLLKKAALFATDEAVEVDTIDETPTIDNVVDTNPADDGINTADETIEYSGDSAQVDGSVPTTMGRAMKMLAVSAINQRRATACLSRQYTSRVTEKMLHELRYALPDEFKRRYEIHY